MYWLVLWILKKLHHIINQYQYQKHWIWICLCQQSRDSSFPEMKAGCQIFYPQSNTCSILSDIHATNPGIFIPILVYNSSFICENLFIQWIATYCNFHRCNVSQMKLLKRKPFSVWKSSDLVIMKFAAFYIPQYWHKLNILIDFLMGWSELESNSATDKL